MPLLSGDPELHYKKEIKYSITIDPYAQDSKFGISFRDFRVAGSDIVHKQKRQSSDQETSN